MAQPYPAQLAEFFDALQVTTATFELPVTQQLSRTAGGEVITAELGTSLWRGSVTLARRPYVEANRALALIRRMARPGASFLVRPHLNSRPSDAATAAALQLNSGADFAQGSNAWTSGTLVTDLPGQPPAGLTAALHGTERNLYDGGSRVAMANLADTVFRITGWAWNTANAFDLQVGINRENASGTAGATLSTIAAAGQSGWVFFDASVSAPSDAVLWRPMIRSNGATGDPGHDFHVANLRWSKYALASISSDARDISLSGLPTSAALSPGDCLSFSYGGTPVRYGFHQITDPAVAAGTGTTPAFEVVPPLRPGAAVGAQVALIDPVLKAVIDPGSVREGRAVRNKIEGISFGWIQTLR